MNLDSLIERMLCYKWWALALGRRLIQLDVVMDSVIISIGLLGDIDYHFTMY